jgi:hypothetical protein
MAKANNGTPVPGDQMLAFSQLSLADMEQLMKNKKAETARIAAEKGAEARKDVERYCQQKHGLTLAQIWMAGWFAEPKTYRNPATGQTYTYSGRGKVPEWLNANSGRSRPPFRFEFAHRSGMKPPMIPI